MFVSSAAGHPYEMNLPDSYRSLEEMETSIIKICEGVWYVKDEAYRSLCGEELKGSWCCGSFASCCMKSATLDTTN